MNMKDYANLTLRGKAQRLRKMALKALEDYDLDVKKVSLITNDQNGIFRVDTNSKRQYVLRVCLPDGGHTIEEINSEMMLLNALQRDPDINAPVPLATKSGQWVTTVEMDGVPQARQCVVFSWVPGVDLADRRSPANWCKFGALSARLHRFAAAFTPPENFCINTYDSVFPFNEVCVLFDDEYRQHFSTEELDLLKLALDRVQAEIDHLYHENKGGLRVIHGDLHQWNVRIARGKLSPIDFEDLFWAYPVQDIATTLYYSRFDDRHEPLLAAFKQGYETILPFPEEHPGQLETHMLARRLNLLNYVFAAEELDIAQYPNFIPVTLERIRWVQQHIWDN